MSPSGMELDTATLLSTSIESILYGISLVLFAGTLWALIHGRPKDEINWSTMLVALIFTILSTIHLVIDIQRVVYGFTTKLGGFPQDPANFFADTTQITFIAKSVAYVLQTMLGDGVIVYRCYVVWKRPAFIVLPAVMWCATLVTSSRFLYNFPRETDPRNAFLLGVGKWVFPFFLLTMATNVLSSALLAYGIWSIDRNEPQVTRIPSRFGIRGTLVLRILVDSAALYTLMLFVMLVCCLCESTGQFIVLDMMTPIISITFYTVLVRIAIARNDTSNDDTATLLSSLRFAASPSPSEPALTVARRSSI